MSATAAAPRASLAPLCLLAGGVVFLAVMSGGLAGMPDTEAARPAYEASVNIPAALDIPLPVKGQATVRIGPHAEKHNGEVLAPELIRQRIVERRYEIWYSLARQQFLFLVRIEGQCGGMIVRFDAGGGYLYEATCFGSACGYWEGVIVADKYQRIG